MSFGPTIFPRNYSAIPMLPEGEDCWLTLEGLVAFVRHDKPPEQWHRLYSNWPWRWQDGEKLFSAYAAWKRMHEFGKAYRMPPGADAHFAPRHAALVACGAVAA